MKKKILIILIVVILIIAGGVGYYFYKEKKAEEPIDETADWKVYTNEKYGFEIKFPESWSDFEVREWEADQSPGRMPPYFDTIEFSIDRIQNNGKEYYFAIRIYPYSHDNWAVRRLGQQTRKYSFISASHLPYPYLGENENYVFSWQASRGILSPEELGEDLAEDVLQLRTQEAESIIATFKVINSVEKTAEWKNYFNPGECKSIGENDYTNECYLESLKAITEIETCKEVRPDYRDFCYFQGAQNLKDFSICEKLLALINQESCYQNIALFSKNASICKNIPTERWRNTCYGDIAELLKDPLICEEIENQKARGYCLRGSNPEQPELPIAPISEWKTYINKKHKYSFKHPPKWDFTVSLTNPDDSPLHTIRELITNQTVTHEWRWVVTIDAWDNPSELSLIDWLKFRREPGVLIPENMPFVANAFVGEEKIEALRLWRDGTSTWDKPGKCFQACPSLAVYFVYKDKAYLAGLEYRGEVNDVGQESQETFDQILSTFKFEDEIVQISVSVDMESFDLENKTFEGWIRTGERRKVKVISDDSTEFYRTSDPEWEKEYFTFSELYSNTSSTWPLAVKGIFEEENIIKANEVFIIAQ